MKPRPEASFVLVLAGVALSLAGRAQAAAEAPPTLSEVFRRVDPAVVEIHTTESDIPPVPGSLPVSVSGLGSGVLITPDGKILTAAHVVQTAEITALRPADQVTVVVLRGGKAVTLTTQVPAQP